MLISNSKIVTRILFSLLIILVFSFATIGFLIYELKSTEGKMKDIFSIYIVSNASAEIQKTLDVLKNNISDCIAAVEKRDKDTVSACSMLFPTLYQTIEKNFKNLNKWVKDARGKELLEKADKTFNILPGLEKEVIELYDSNNFAQIIQNLNDLDDEQNRYNLEFSQWNLDVRTTASDTYNQVKQYVTKDIIISLGVSLILLVVSVFITLFISRNISGSISFFKEIFEKGASGNLNASYPVKVKARDEISELGKFFNKFINEVRKVITEVVDASNDLGASSEEVSVTISNFAENSQSQAAASEEITAAMEEISAGVDNVSENSLFQHNKLNEFILQMNDLSDMINLLADRITEAEKSSEDISEQARAGNKSLGLMDTIMKKITESSKKVSDIVGIIMGISDKINLLSLNAAIEAARAGEAGRGFAVVADEISKLADQTAASISDIDSLIKKNNNEITDGMTNVFDTVDSIGRVIEGVESINQMMSSIYSDMEKQKTANESVNKSAEDLRIRSEEVKNSTEEQRTAVSEVMKSITSINELIQASAAGAEEMTANANKLASMAVQMKDRISFFAI